jgi:cytochrome P450
MTAAAQPQELLVRLLDPSNRADPYPAYAEIRERGPIRLPEINLTVFSSYRDCDEVLRHPSAASDFRKATPVQAALSAADEVDAYGEPSFLFLDPPDHTRLRKLVSKAFVPKVVKALEPDITTLVDALLDSVAQKGTFDVIADLAHPLPVAVICRLLGVPLEDEPEFSAASALSVQSLDPFITFTGQAPENMERQVQAEAWLFDYLRDLVTRRRSDPADDLMSALIQVEESGDQLTEEEIIATCTLLLVAGHETTVNLIANAILAMLRQPQQWAALAGNASREPAVVEETLRYDPPVQLMGRIAADDMTIGETTVVKGDTTMLLLAAAQRDPAAYDRPDEFDPDRESIRHLAFGKGPHFCLGAPLARLEGRVAFTALLTRFPEMRLAVDRRDLHWSHGDGLVLRGLAELPVRLGPSRPAG